MSGYGIDEKLDCPNCGEKMKFVKQKQQGFDCNYYCCEPCGEFHDE
jgi:uncharacterized Zn finger protein